MLRCRIDTRLGANPGSVVKRQIDQQSLSHVLHVQQISCKKTGNILKITISPTSCPYITFTLKQDAFALLLEPISARSPALAALQTSLFPDTSGTRVLCLRIMINVAPSAPSTMHYSFCNKCIPRLSITPTPAPTSSQIQQSHAPCSPNSQSSSSSPTPQSCASP